MTIEIISIPDCPNHQATVELVKQLLGSEHVSAEIKEVLVRNSSQAQAHGFAGSPTVRVNGKDIEVLTFPHTGLSCRIYEDGSGIPPQSLLRQAIISASLISANLISANQDEAQP